MKNKRIIITLISCLLIASFLVSGTAYAQEDELPDPGLTPDSPFYFLDKWGKGIGLAFTFGNEAKANKALQYAEERLAEVEAMATANRTREMKRAADDCEGYLNMVNERAAEAVRQGASGNITERLAQASTRHLRIMDRLQDEEPAAETDNTTGRLRAAIMNEEKHALRLMAQNNPEMALELAVDAVANRLERARIKATENVTAQVQAALADVEDLAEIEDEIAALAEQLGQYSPEMQQRLAHATANRLEVLAGVYENAPEAARLSIENAMENSVRKYERAVEKLKLQNALGETPETAPALERIQQEVRDRIQNRIANETQNNSDNTSLKIKEQTQQQEQLKEHTSDNKTATPEPTGNQNSNQNGNQSGGR